jgi:hypothetical protein
VVAAVAWITVRSGQAPAGNQAAVQPSSAASSAQIAIAPSPEIRR